MLVIKRDQRKESVKFDKITARIEKLSYGINTKYVKTIEIAKKDEILSKDTDMDNSIIEI